MNEKSAINLQLKWYRYVEIKQSVRRAGNAAKMTSNTKINRMTRYSFQIISSSTK